MKFGEERISFSRKSMKYWEWRSLLVDLMLLANANLKNKRLLLLFQSW